MIRRSRRRTTSATATATATAATTSCTKKIKWTKGGWVWVSFVGHKPSTFTQNLLLAQAARQAGVWLMGSKERMKSDGAEYDLESFFLEPRLRFQSFSKVFCCSTSGFLLIFPLLKRWPEIHRAPNEVRGGSLGIEGLRMGTPLKFWGLEAEKWVPHIISSDSMLHFSGVTCPSNKRGSNVAKPWWN